MSPRDAASPLRFALAGNPNSGKTTLFNAMTGKTAHVGNWAGVTVERKEGLCRAGSEPALIVDLPGIYSLSPYTPEEIVSRNYIFDEKPDLIINIVDATNIERNLYMTTQILELDCPVVVALNMSDVLDKEGRAINAETLAERLGVPCVPVSALRGERIPELLEAAIRAAKAERRGSSVLAESPLIGQAVRESIGLFSELGAANPVFQGVKALENEGITIDKFPNVRNLLVAIRSQVEIPANFSGDIEAVVADARYKYITELKKSLFFKASQRKEVMTGKERSEKIDRVMTHRIFGIPIFLLIMFTIFHLIFSDDFLFLRTLGILEEGIPSPGIFLGDLTQTLSGLIISGVSGFMEGAGASDWAVGLVADGVLAGMASVLGFLPLILLLFLFLSLMEDSGYMARAAFLMDRLLKKLGLSGKAFIPLLMGFGCSVPAIMGTRTLESQNERRLTIILTPFFSCGAKLPVWALFAAALFPSHGDVAVFSIYLIGIVTAILVALALKKTVLKSKATPFIMELPSYHRPQLRNTALILWEKLRGFLIRATTIIAGASVVIWVLQNFSFGLQMVEPGGADSILGVIGGFIAPVFKPLGFASGANGWKAAVAILTGLIAKEMVVSTMGVLYNPGIAGDALEDEGAATALIAAVGTAFSPLAAISFMAFNLLCVPCMAAVATANAELGRGKWTWAAIGVWLCTAWVVSFVIFNVGTLLGF